jgi:hypothetical protein
MLVNGCFGSLAAQGSWEWAVHSPHPHLVRWESWLPLRGQWLVIAAAVALLPVRWVRYWLMLCLAPALLCSTPVLDPMLGPPLVLLGLGCVGLYGAHLRSKRSSPLPSTQEQFTETQQ